jgi:hypothetical protein
VLAQRLFEYQAVQEFIKAIDRLGLPIPGGAFAFPKWSDDLLELQQSFWQGATTFHPAFALARHHGMPSRLSDWTENPLTAAFFASEPSERSLSDRLAVWAYDTLSESPQGRPRVRTFLVERSSIGFLHAQEALFLYIPGGNSLYSRHGRWPSFEESAAEEALVKLTLPKSEIPQLRRLLAAEGIDRPRLKPPHDHVADWLNEQWTERP